MPMRHDRYFTPEPTQKRIALDLYERVVDLPLICPYSYVDPAIFAEPDYHFVSPVEVLISPDQNVLRMLTSQGIPLESLGVKPLDGTPYETDHRTIWRTFAGNFHLFAGTPSGIWIRETLESVFGIAEKLNADTSDRLYDRIAAALETPNFTPRKLYERFNIEVLCTTDAATDTLEHHKAIRASGWQGRTLPTFRPDAVLNTRRDDWQRNIGKLSATSGVDVVDYTSFRDALAIKRAIFRSLGAVASDHGWEFGVLVSNDSLAVNEAFNRVLTRRRRADDSDLIHAHALMDMAHMSMDDDYVMQMYIGSHRNHNTELLRRFGRDIGADKPAQIDFTYDLLPFLNTFGNTNITVILFTFDELTYSRELAPLAGDYPALKLGSPRWFHDSPNGMRRYFDQVMETAGIYNTVGFNDDTRTFLSIAARHDLWRRMACDWLAGLLLRGMVDEADAHMMAVQLAYGLVKKAYNL